VLTEENHRLVENGSSLTRCQPSCQIVDPATELSMFSAKALGGLPLGAHRSGFKASGVPAQPGGPRVGDANLMRRDLASVQGLRDPDGYRRAGSGRVVDRGGRRRRFSGPLRVRAARVIYAGGRATMLQRGFGSGPSVPEGGVDRTLINS
jgi:hypothetical protein